MSMASRDFVRGTDGRVWLDGELMMNAKSFEGKATVNKDEVYVNGDYTAKHVYTGNSIAGTLTAYKVNSHVLSKYKDALATGVIPDTSIVGMSQNPSTGRKERVAYYGVIFDEVTLTRWENNTLTEEELPFTADSFKVLEEM